MAESAEPLELIHLADGTQSVVVRVLSTQPGYYDAEIVIRSDFVNATVRTDFDADDIGEWGDLLDAVEDDDADIEQDEDDVFAGNWPREGRAAYLTFETDEGKSDTPTRHHIKIGHFKMKTLPTAEGYTSVSFGSLSGFCSP